MKHGTVDFGSLNMILGDHLMLRSMEESSYNCPYLKNLILNALLEYNFIASYSQFVLWGDIYIPWRILNHKF